MSNRKSAILKTAWDLRDSVSVSKRARIWPEIGTHIRHGDTPRPFFCFGRNENGRCKIKGLKELYLYGAFHPEDKAPYRGHIKTVQISKIKNSVQTQNGRTKRHIGQRNKSEPRAAANHKTSRPGTTPPPTTTHPDPPPTHPPNASPPERTRRRPIAPASAHKPH